MNVNASNRKTTITGFALLTLALALLALLSPLSRAESVASRAGWLLAMAAVIEALHAVRQRSTTSQREGTGGAWISMAIAVALINGSYLAPRALLFAIAAWFALDCVWKGVRFFRRSGGIVTAIAAIVDGAAALLLILAEDLAFDWIVAIGAAVRIFKIAWHLIIAPPYSGTAAEESVIAELGLSGQPEAEAIATEVNDAEHMRSNIDLSWTVAFIATLFAIHMGRMRTELTFVGILSPGVAVLGDMVLSVLVTLFIANPIYLLWRRPTRFIERRVWTRYLSRSPAERGWIDRVSLAWLRWRLRSAIRMRSARLSIPTALKMGLKRGLPFAAILAATVPIWGMSWYFDTENWAAGMWNSWAASRTDTWREAMVRAVQTASGDGAAPSTFAIEPPGVDGGDFSFVVIGDTGEGDASQHVLRDQLISVANSPDVRFVVLSSDVVYPVGGMNDYEAKFWLPFKGVTRPVYAIPGNHDWYDALEAFSATFLQPDAARACIRARAESDLRVTSTTEARIDGLIHQAQRLREAYSVPTGFQRGPFFEIQTDRFALLAIDTGVLKSLDQQEAIWLDAALGRSAGKTTMAILGHPFYAGGHDVALGNESFTQLKQTLLQRGVTLVMAGDTHDFEYYVEPSVGAAPAVHHFVNGGGGAYLSFGTALAWPSAPPTSSWAYYPDRNAVTGKVDAFTPWWKRPVWGWTRRFGAWPLTAEFLSAAFDYNVAPFFQSFVEVKVEPSANQVRVILHGVHGRLKWAEIATSAGMRPAIASDDDYVEWIVPMSPAAPPP